MHALHHLDVPVMNHQPHYFSALLKQVHEAVITAMALPPPPQAGKPGWTKQQVAEMRSKTVARYTAVINDQWQDSPTIALRVGTTRCTVTQFMRCEEMMAITERKEIVGRSGSKKYFWRLKPIA